MAKYTEQFGEWLKNHSLPVIFDEIESLKDLFILKYIDCEIGYETEWLFEQKLILKANIVIPNNNAYSLSRNMLAETIPTKPFTPSVTRVLVR